MIRFADVIITPLILIFYSWLSPTKSAFNCSAQRLIVGVGASVPFFSSGSPFGLTAALRACISSMLWNCFTRCGSQEAFAAYPRSLRPLRYSTIFFDFLGPRRLSVPPTGKQVSPFCLPVCIPMIRRGRQRFSIFLNHPHLKKQISVSAFPFSRRLFQDPKPEGLFPATGSAGAGLSLTAQGSSATLASPTARSG